MIYAENLVPTPIVRVSRVLELWPQAGTRRPLRTA